MAGSDVERTGYGTFERLLYLFLIPLVFVTILLGVLLSLFDYDIKGSMLKIGNQIPFLEKIVPDPVSETPAVTTDKGSMGKAASSAQEMADLKAKTAEQESSLADLDVQVKQKDQTIADLMKQVADLEERLKTKIQTEEEYTKQVQALASVYAKMTPSKSAPIIENLTLKEQVLVLSEMKPDERVKILEKMDAKKAAEASILMKDIVPVKDREIAALQERLAINGIDTKTADKMSATDLGQTFSGMNAKSAAAILIAMNTANQPKVLSILHAMDNTARGQLLAAIADANKDVAAVLATKLGE
ncbi:MotE family protein [Paenibacillus sp. y28]|uniref:MotE family protein n=1 Tax=Paenibacillus sp. y28 TaxID=3129110 RepID=UPI003017A62D